MYLFTMPMNKAKKTSIFAAALAAALALAAVAAARTDDTTLSFVAYSTPKTVMGKIIQAWQKTPDGSGVSFNQSYGASTDQARAVAQGLKADLVFLSTGDDVNLLSMPASSTRSGTGRATTGSQPTRSWCSRYGPGTRSTSSRGRTWSAPVCRS